MNACDSGRRPSLRSQPVSPAARSRSVRARRRPPPRRRRRLPPRRPRVGGPPRPADVRGRPPRRQPAVRRVRDAAVQLSLHAPPQPHRPARGDTLADAQPRERVPEGRRAAGPRRPSLQLRGQGHRGRHVLRERLHQEGADRLSRRLDGARASSSTSRCRTTGPPPRRWTTRCEKGPDGSASIWVGNQDRVYGMQWRVALRPAPGPGAAAAGRGPLQPQRHPAPLLLVEQRRRARVGRQPHRVSDALHRLARVPRRSTPGPSTRRAWT